MTAFCVVGTITADTCDSLVNTDLLEQTRQHRCIASSVIGHLDSTDFQRGGVNPQVDLAPLATIIGPMFLPLPLAFTEHFDASAVDQKMHACRRRVRFNRYGEMLLTPADSTKNQVPATPGRQA